MPKTKRAAPHHSSQNFLTSGKTIRRLLSHTSIGPADTVLDIGAGKGHITRELAARCGRVLAVEIDPALCTGLREKFAPAKNVRVLQQDFLRLTLPPEPYKVFANIPFCHTTAILNKLLTAQNPPGEAWLVLEQGAAKRFCGVGGDTLSCLRLRPFYALNIVHHFSRQDFHPAPGVGCVLLHIRQLAEPALAPRQMRAWHRFLAAAKQRGITALLTKKQISAALRLAGLPQVPTSGNMLYVQWLCLFRCWQKFNAG